MNRDVLILLGKIKILSNNFQKSRTRREALEIANNMIQLLDELYEKL